MKLPGLGGKTAIITGASRGIGTGIARVLGAQGMRLVLTARSEQDGLEFTRSLREGGVECRWVTADLSDRRAARGVFEAAVESYGGVDLLVNNAARQRSRSILELDEEEYRLSFEKNVRIVYHITRPVARHMAERGGGNIVNISSVGGLRTHRNRAGYDASKGALDALTRSMAADLAPYGVRVNAVAPGATERPRDRARDSYERRRKLLAEKVPIPRAGRPEEVGAAVAFLASEAAAYVTGQILYVDGGLTIQLTPPGVYV